MIRRCPAPLFAVLTAAAAATLPSWKALDLANAARAFAAARAWPPMLQRAVARRSVACDLVRGRRGWRRWMLAVEQQEKWDCIFPIIFLTKGGFSHGIAVWYSCIVCHMGWGDLIP